MKPYGASISGIRVVHPTSKKTSRRCIYNKKWEGNSVVTLNEWLRSKKALLLHSWCQQGEQRWSFSSRGIQNCSLSNETKNTHFCRLYQDTTEFLHVEKFVVRVPRGERWKNVVNRHIPLSYLSFKLIQFDNKWKPNQWVYLSRYCIIIIYLLDPGFTRWGPW